MACGGCSAVRKAGIAALGALASGDRAAYEASLARLQDVNETEFAAKPLKAAATRAVQSGLARLAARTR